MRDIHGNLLTLERIRFLRNVKGGHVNRNDKGRDRLKVGNRNSFVERRCEQEKNAGLIHLEGGAWKTTEAGDAVIADYDARRSGIVTVRTA